MFRRVQYVFHQKFVTGQNCHIILHSFSVSGWGTLTFHGRTSNYLMSVDVPVVSDDGNIQSRPKKFVLGCVIPTAGSLARSRNLGQTFLANSVHSDDLFSSSDEIVTFVNLLLTVDCRWEFVKYSSSFV